MSLFFVKFQNEITLIGLGLYTIYQKYMHLAQILFYKILFVFVVPKLLNDNKKNSCECLMLRSKCSL